MADKFRVGRNQGRAILYVDSGKEFLVFPSGEEEGAQEFCDFLNRKALLNFEGFEERPKIEETLVGMSLSQVHNEYLKSPKLFAHIQFLDRHIDYLESKQDDLFKFTQWCGDNYIHLHGVWCHKHVSQLDKSNWKTTQELYKYYLYDSNKNIIGR